MKAPLQIKTKTSTSASQTFAPVRGGVLQRKCACGGTPRPTGECEACGKKKLRRSAEHPSPFIPDPSEAPPIVHEVLRSPGQPLDSATRAFMEPRFGYDFRRLPVYPNSRADGLLTVLASNDLGELQADDMARRVAHSASTTARNKSGSTHDFGSVRVHTDGKAAKSARALNARAYTVGNHIVFAENQYTAETLRGRELIAHELTHVAQQSDSVQSSSVQRQTPGPVPASASTDSLKGGLSEGMQIRPAIADANVLNCDPKKNPNQEPSSVRAAHVRALELLDNADSTSGNIADPKIQAMAWAHFHLTLPAANQEDKLLWAHVRRAFSAMKRADTEAVYECEPKQNVFNGLCVARNIAVSLDHIHLCPDFWIFYPTTDERAHVLVHEWGHKFGTGINRIFETYTYQKKFATLAAKVMVHQPDAYANYAFELLTGKTPPL